MTERRVWATGVVASVIMVAGCTHRSDDRIGFPDLPDAGSTAPDAGDPCATADLATDMRHCGACGVSCRPSDADRCVDGSCRCGTGAPCGEGEDCRYGGCHPVDPDGDVCEFDDVCPPGHACIEAHCSPLRCIDLELCDGADNDCDGAVDEGNGGPLSEWCFDGMSSSMPPDVAPPCMAGVRVCADGEWSSCIGEVPPVPETGLLGCDGSDNDCDGCVDGVLEGGVCVSREPIGFDIVFVVDVSGSMSGKIAAVTEAVRTFSAGFAARTTDRFAIVLVGATGGDLVVVRHDLSAFAAFEAELLTVRADGGGDEPQWDAVYELGTGDLALSWREDAARIIIVFTDEEGQTYRYRSGLSPVHEVEMCGSLTRGEVLAVVAEPAHHADFDDCGLTYPISDDAVEMAAHLDTIISDPCG